HTPRYSLVSPPHRHHRDLHSFPTRRSSDLPAEPQEPRAEQHERDVVRYDRRALEVFPGPEHAGGHERGHAGADVDHRTTREVERSEEHTSELQSRVDLVCRLLLEKKKRTKS